LIFATPEKALLDLIYLSSYGKYKFDTSAIDYDKFNKNKVKDLLNKFPNRVNKFMPRYLNYERTKRARNF